MLFSIEAATCCTPIASSWYAAEPVACICRAVWTIVTRYWQDCHYVTLNDIRRSSTLLHVSSVKRQDEAVLPVLRDELHWLPIKQRVDSKVGIISFRTMNGLAPTYGGDVRPCLF